MELSSDAVAHLRCYTPETYGMNLPRDVRQELEKAGLVEWVPYTQWSGQIYGLTERGKEELAKLEPSHDSS